MKNEITVDGVTYYSERNNDLMSDSVLVRGDRSGVFIGKMVSRNGR